MMLDSPQDDLNFIHAITPRPGDYWHERFSPVCVVVSVDDDVVTICKEKKDVDEEHWTWDLSKTTRITKKEFKDYLKYKNLNRFWADVIPERMKWVCDEYQSRSN